MCRLGVIVNADCNRIIATRLERALQWPQHLQCVAQIKEQGAVRSNAEVAPLSALTTPADGGWMVVTCCFAFSHSKYA
jgi:hypothetical protein